MHESYLNTKMVNCASVDRDGSQYISNYFSLSLLSVQYLLLKIIRKIECAMQAIKI